MKGQENKQELKGSQSVVNMGRCLREPRPQMLRSKSANGKRIPLKATASLASSGKKIPRHNKMNKMSSSYTYLKMKLDELREQSNIDGLNATMLPRTTTSPQTGEGSRSVRTIENVISRASLTADTVTVSQTPGMTFNPLFDPQPILTPLQAADMQKIPAEAIPELERENFETISEKLELANTRIPECIEDACFCEKESEESWGMAQNDDPTLLDILSNSGTDEDVNDSRSGSAITVIRALSSMSIQTTSSELRLESESSIQTVFRSDNKEMKNVSRRSRSVCELHSSYNSGSIQGQGYEGESRSKINENFIVEDQSCHRRRKSSPDIKNEGKHCKKPDDSTQFLMSPIANATDSIISTCVENPSLSSSISISTLPTRLVSKSCNYLKLHELAVEEILKEKLEAVSTSLVRTQSLPDVLLKDERYGLKWAESSQSPNFQMKFTSFQLQLKKLNEKIPVHIIMSAIFVLSLWLCFDFMADQCPRKVKFSWHW
jgi:hypothetical protein